MRSKQMTRRIRGVRRHRLALALVGAMAMPMPVLAQSLPDSPEVVSGTVGPFQYTGTELVIDQTSQGAIIDWGSFSIGNGYGVTFNLPNGTSVVLNRVIGPGYGSISPSNIDGSLTSNGNVFIINPAGIVFGGGAQVNVGGLVASALWMSDSDFANGLATGQYLFSGFNGDTSTARQVENFGEINAGAGGVGFIGPVLSNSGDIVSTGGNIAFGAGTTVTLDFVGDGLTQVTINVPPTEDSGIVQNAFGTMTADGGSILLRSATTAAGTGGTIMASGILRAQSIANVNGRVELTSNGTVMLGALGVFSDASTPFTTGTIDVSGQGGESGGSVLLDGGAVWLVNDDPAAPTEGSRIDASGGTSGGSVSIFGNTTVLLDALSEIDATGATGSGGQIDVQAADLAAFGSLLARGGTIGGSITTVFGNQFDIRGLQVDAGGGTAAGNWTLDAPDFFQVVNGNAVGSSATIALGSALQDAEINGALASGTSVTLNTPEGVNFDGAQIASTSPLDLSFIVNAGDSITGNDFSITSGAGALDMVFNADAQGANTGFAYIDFYGAALDSNGGDILMYGRSDPANGAASSFATGVYLGDSTLVTSGGDVLLRGESTGGDAGADDAGVVLSGTTIDAGAGSVQVFGSGMLGVSGVIATGGSIATAGGDVLLDGRSDTGDGLWLDAFDIASGGGDIALLGYGGDIGVYADFGDVDSGGGDILVHGEGGTGNGVDISVLLASGGGDITVYSLSTDAIGLVAGGYGGIESSGGDILLEGQGATGGVTLVGNGYGDGNVDSGGGAITIIGGADGAGAVGVSFVTADVLGGTGNVSVTGTSPAGIGIQFAGGAGITTTTGAISLTGTGADFGLDIADGAIDTDSGDINLDGTATAADAVAGVRVTGPGLVTNGGDISVTGNSAGGVGVQLGDGSTFAIGSGGGAISIAGVGVDAGVLMQGNQVASGGGAVSISGDGGALGVSLDGSDVDSGDGGITVAGTATDTDGVGVSLDDAQLAGGAGGVSVTGSAVAGIGIGLSGGSSVSSTTGAISLTGTGADFGLDIADGAIDTDSGDILLDGTATAADAIAGVRVTGPGLVTNGGDISVTGSSAGGVGVQLGDGTTFAIGSGGGAISIDGTGVDAGVLMQGNQVASGGGAVSISGDGGALGVSLDGSDVDSGAGAIDIAGTASASGGVGVDLTDAQLAATSGAIGVLGNAAAGSGLRFGGTSGIETTTGDISLTGIGLDVGLAIEGGEFTTDSGHIDLRGRGMGAGSAGLVIGDGIAIATDGGGIELSGEGGSGAGISLGAGASVDAGDSLVVVRAANAGGGDAIVLDGVIRSGVGVNLRPGGVDANGGVYDRVDDEILIGGSGGFALSGAELAMIDAPELVIGSSAHAAAIRVLGATTREGNLTLQNDGGAGGIDLQAALDVGDGTLALSSGGSITQTAAGAITAHSLLASSGGDVLLAEAANNVADTTLAGSAAGDFEFQDVDTLAIGSVSASGFDAASGQLSGLGATGIDAGGDVFVRNLDGDMTLNAGVTASNIDLVTAGRLQNVAGASLVASGDWRVWAETWEGETRGGLAGSGDLPNLYGCAWLGACGVTVTGDDNHFIYVQQPIAQISFDDATREYGLENPTFTFSVTGAILGDSAAAVATGTATTTATIGSDVGLYPILGEFTSAAGYRIELLPGSLSITPATLIFTANPFVRYLGFPNPTFSGEVAGFRNGDTVESVFGSDAIWSSPAGPLSPIGYYPIVGGSSARNYVFVQAETNLTALQVIPLPQLPSTPVEWIRDPIDTYVYDSNIATMPVCAVNASIDDQGLASTGDTLSTEWSKVRSRPNLTNCFDSDRRDACGDF